MYENLHKYPRTSHLPWSASATSDDIYHLDLSHFVGKEIVVTEKMDATNTRADGRKWVVDLGKDYGAFTKIISLQTPVRELLKRNQKRMHPIPIKALMHQINRMEHPFLLEAHAVEYLSFH